MSTIKNKTNADINQKTTFINKSKMLVTIIMYSTCWYIPHFGCVTTKWSITEGYVLECETLKVRHYVACRDQLGTQTVKSSLMSSIDAPLKHAPYNQVQGL